MKKYLAIALLLTSSLSWAGVARVTAKHVVKPVAVETAKGTESVGKKTWAGVKFVGGRVKAVAYLIGHLAYVGAY